MSKQYLSPPSRSDFEYFNNFSDFQIVVLCELELLRSDKKFKMDGPRDLLNKFIISWRDNEFSEISFRDKSSFSVDIQKIIPFKWCGAFKEMANKNHLHIFKDKLSDSELQQIDNLISDVYSKWSKDFRRFTTMDWLNDKEMVLEWDDSKSEYVKID